jgi:hypothetical protein
LKRSEFITGTGLLKPDLSGDYSVFASGCTTGIFFDKQKNFISLYPHEMMNENEEFFSR